MKTLVAMLLAVSASTSFAATSHKIDTKATKVAWEGTKVTGRHEGNIAVKSGTITVDGELITAGDVVVDMNSLTVNDIPADQPGNAKLVGHLKSPDFFDVAKYPEAKLVITGSEKTKNGLKVKGNLTMIGQTKPVEFVANLKKSADAVTAKSQIKLDRTKWGLKYGSADFFKGLADKAIHNEFTLTIDLTAKK